MLIVTFRRKFCLSFGTNLEINFLSNIGIAKKKKCFKKARTDVYTKQFSQGRQPFEKLSFPYIVESR